MNKDLGPLMVTIWCFTYNQRNYIEDCLRGFVSQKTSFRFQAFVHDDASTDGTDLIIKEYSEKYPQIIKPFFETENQYSKNNGFIHKLIDSHTNSKYVAICEGDDYWIDPNKLQKQYDLLESDPSISMCHHNYYQLYSDGRKEVRVADVPQRQNLLSLAKYNSVQTLTMFFRYVHPLIPEVIADKHIYTSFWPMRMAEVGDIFYINEPMAVYRYNEGGIYSMQSRLKKYDMATSNLDTMIYWYEKNKKNDVVYEIKRRARKMSITTLLHFLKNFQLGPAIKVFRKAISYK